MFHELVQTKKLFIGPHINVANQTHNSNNVPKINKFTRNTIFNFEILVTSNWDNTK